jgi:hypothetical protein
MLCRLVISSEMITTASGLILSLEVPGDGCSEKDRASDSELLSAGAGGVERPTGEFYPLPVELHLKMNLDTGQMDDLIRQALADREAGNTRAI